MESLEEGADVGLEGWGADLAEDELGVTDIGLGLTGGFEVELVFGRWEVMDVQLWSFGKRCWGQNSL